MAGYFPVTLATLIANVRRFIEDMPATDSITANVAATPASGVITLTVNDVSQWPLDTRMELDDEVFIVQSNPGGSGAGTVTALRAYESTVAAAHTSGTIAVRAPRFLKANIREAINIVVHSWCSTYFPQLVWDDGTTGGTFNPIKWLVPSPADAMSIERVRYQIPGIQKHIYVAHGNLQMLPAADVTNPVAFVPGGVLGFELQEQGMPGQPIEVLYGKRWPYLTLDTDQVPLDFPEEGQDLIETGATLYLTGWRMIPKFRTSEVIFNREGGVAIPTNQNLQLAKMSIEQWRFRAMQIRARRPDNWPTKVYVGFDS